MPRALETGERVYLRRLAEQDRHELCALRRDSWPFLAPWEPRPPRGETGHGAAWFERQRAAARRRNADKTLLCRRSDDALLGVLNLNQIVRGNLQSAFAGYWIGAPFARQGYMGEGLVLLLKHAFERVQLHRVEANVRPENAASLALVRRVGFRPEGLAERYLRIDGRWCDHERWAVTVEDWRARGGR